MDEGIAKRKCFGTKEFSLTSAICVTCKDYKECREYKNKKLNWDAMEYKLYKSKGKQK